MVWQKPLLLNIPPLREGLGGPDYEKEHLADYHSDDDHNPHRYRYNPHDYLVHGIMEGFPDGRPFFMGNARMLTHPGISNCIKMLN